MDSFMFLVNGRFVYPRVFEERLQKLCDNVNIKYRSIHKIRKTVCSTLVGSGVNINTVREIMGHSDEKTTVIDREGAPSRPPRGCPSRR